MIIVPTGNGYYTGRCGNYLFSKKFIVEQSTACVPWYGKTEGVFASKIPEEVNPYYEIIKTLSEKVWN